MKLEQNKRTQGFTLIEVLVVMFILSILASILMVTLNTAFNSGRKKITESQLQELKIALSLYEKDYGDSPPSTLQEIGLKSTSINTLNNINNGIETLVICLSSSFKESADGEASYYEFHDNNLSNTDMDTYRGLNCVTRTTFDTIELFELTDPWGNPYIYFHYRDIIKDNYTQIYKIKDEKIPVKPFKITTKTGKIKTKYYQIISLGKDGELNTDDDIIKGGE